MKGGKMKGGKMKINKKRKFLLKELRKDGRMTLTEVSRNASEENINLPVTTAHDNLRQLEEKAIEKFVPLLKWDMLGYDSTVFIIEIGNDRSFLNFIKRNKRINSAVAFEEVVLIEVMTQNQEEMEEFRRKMEQFDVVVHEKSAEFIKRESFIPEVSNKHG